MLRTLYIDQYNFYFWLSSDNFQSQYGNYQFVINGYYTEYNYD